MLLSTIILIISATAVFSRENHLSKFIISQALSWCEYHPFGLIYSDDKSYNCFLYRGKSGKLKNTLENVKLRVGVIPVSISTIRVKYGSLLKFHFLFHRTKSITITTAMQFIIMTGCNQQVVTAIIYFDHFNII